MDRPRAASITIQHFKLQEAIFSGVTMGVRTAPGDTLQGLHPTERKQVAQLSQRDRAAGWVSYGQK